MKRSEAVIIVTDSLTTMLLTIFDPEIGPMSGQVKVTMDDDPEEHTDFISAVGHEPIMEASKLISEQVIGALESNGLVFEEG